MSQIDGSPYAWFEERVDAHRPWRPHDDLKRTPALACGASVLTVQELRTLSKNLALNYIDKITFG